MATQPSKETLVRFARAGLLPEAHRQPQVAVEPSSVEPDHEHTRAALAADIGAAIGALLILIGTLTLAFLQLAVDETAQLVTLAVAGIVSLSGAWATRNLLPRAASDWLAGIGGLLISVCTVPGAALTGYEPGSFAEGWILGCITALLVGGALSLWLRSRLAGAVAASALVALPAALALPASFENASWPFAFTEPMPPLTLWGTLSLMALCLLLVELLSMHMDRAGWADRGSTEGAVIASSTVVGIALVSAATTQGASWFYFFLIAAAVVVTGISVWRRERTWLSLSARLFTASTLTTLFNIDENSSMVMALVLLGLTLFTFTPLRQRLPSHWAVLRWEAWIWLNGFAIACAFASTSNAGLYVEWIWALTMIALGALRARPLALVIGVLALFVALLLTVINLLGATIGTGFGTLVFGTTTIIGVIVWRQGVVSLWDRLPSPLPLATRFSLRKRTGRLASLGVRRG